MSDPYRNTDPATLRDDVRRLNERFDRWNDSILRAFRGVVLFVLFPLVVVVIPTTLGVFIKKNEVLWHKVETLQIDRDRQDAQVKALVVEIRHLWQASSDRSHRGELEEEAGWKCIAWRSW